MPWQARNNFLSSDFLQADDLNYLANDDRIWGGDVNGGGHHLYNVILDSSAVPPGSSDVSSVFGRIGNVIAAPGDYSAAQITNAVDATQLYYDPSWIGSLAWSKLVGVPTLVTSAFGRMGNVVAQVGDYTAAQVTNAVDKSLVYADPPWISSLSWSKIINPPPFMTSFNGRSGAVMPQTGDYTVAQVTNAVDKTAIYSDPPWINSLAWSKIVGAPPGQSQTPWTSNQDAAYYTLINLNQLNLQDSAASTVNTLQMGCLDASNAIRVFASRNLWLQGAWQTDVQSPSIVTITTGSTLTERLRVTAAGLVGIGKTAPAYPLDITGDLNITGTYRVNGQPLSTGGYWQAGTGGAIYYSAGNVGIGTSTPSAALDVVGQVVGRADMAGLAYASMQLTLIGVADTRKRLWVGFDTTNNVGVIQAGVSGVSWNSLSLCPSGGSVGIGTASPQAPLHVHLAANQNILLNVGNSLATINAVNDAITAFVPLQYWASSHVFTGHVGIGTTGPLYACHAVQSGAAHQSVIAVENQTIGVYGAGVVFKASDSVTTAGFTAGRIYGVFDANTYANARITIQTPTGNDVFQDVLSVKGTNVGIGTISPACTLHMVTANGVAARANLTQLGVCSWDIQAPASVNALTFGQGGTEFVRISANGFVGIGNSNPPTPLTVASSSSPNLIRLVYGTSYGIIHYNDGNNYYILLTNASDPWGTFNGLRPFYINLANGAVSMSHGLTVGGYLTVSSGNLTVSAGNCNISGQYQINGVNWTGATNWFYTSGQSIGWAAACQISGGTYIAVSGSLSGGVAYYTVAYFTSDMRLKQNIQPLTGGLEIINQVRPIRAEWNGALGKPKGRKLVSVVAQDLAELVPEAMDSFKAKLSPDDAEETDVLTIEPMTLVAHLILAVQQLSTRVEELEKRKN